MFKKLRFLIFTCVSVGLIFVALRFFSEPDISPQCYKIESVPYEIKTAGRYCFAKNLNSSSIPLDKHLPAISITTNDVDLNFMGFCLEGINAKEKVNFYTTVRGIEIKPGSKNIQIRNPCIEGFKYGINLEEIENQAKSSNILIENGQFRNNTFRGIRISADSVIIQNNKIDSTGGDLSFGRDTFSMGITVRGTNCVIKNNEVYETWPTNSGEGVGISISSGGKNCVIRSNIIKNSGFTEYGRTFGIWAESSTRKPLVLINNNWIQNMSYAVSEGQIEVNNLAIDENCNYLKNKNFPSPTPSVYTENFHRFCIDDYDQALLALSSKSTNSIFRIAQIFYDSGHFEDAYVYFSIAGELGSEEALRRTHIMTNLKIIPIDRIEPLMRRVANEKKKLALKAETS